MANITTVIPVYNGEKYISETLQSLAQQTRRPDRVIVVDDGSRDRTEEIVRNFAGIKCEWAPNERNLGLFPNHNSALRFCAETKFFHILHADDTISPTFFEKLIPMIERAPGFAMAFCGYIVVQEDGTPTAQKNVLPGNAPRQFSLREFLRMQSELKSLGLHAVILKTDFKPSPILFPLDFPQLGDVVFHSQFATHCSELWGTPEILCQLRSHGAAATTRNMMSLQAFVKDEWRAMQLANQLLRERGMGAWAHEQKVKLLFAARARVKCKIVKSINPTYAHEIADEAKKTTSLFHWALGSAVVKLRDTLAPKADPGKDRLKPA
jgi:glycosyltransferase involved in cell wall biosynthesis